MKSRWVRFSLIGITVLVIVYYLGPRPAVPQYDLILPKVPQEAVALEDYITNKEGRHHLKPDNQARIVWYDSVPRKTAYSLVYLHGFSASQKEGDPVHRNFAKRYGCNLFLSRLNDHGIDTSEPLLNMTAAGLWQDAKEALSIGKALGDKVIIMSTSTGGTLALQLAASYPNDVHAIINMSPNIAINDDMVFLANNPWGLQLSRMVRNGKYNESLSESPARSQYWYDKYRLEAVVELENLVETSMLSSTFSKVKQPVLDLYYFRDKQHQDPTVKVSAILDMHEQLGTPATLKQAVAIPGAGVHVIGSSLTSHDIPAVEKAINTFAEQKLGLVAQK